MKRPLVLLTFHGVGRPARPLDEGEAPVWVTEDEFVAALDAVKGVPDVQITFDDGNASDAEIALPALVARGMTAAFFLLAGRIGQRGFVDAAAVRDLRAAGMRVGSHGHSHRALRGLAEPAMTEEVRDARRRLEDLSGAPVDELACPFGSYDRRVLARLRAEGYRRVFTSDRWYAERESWLQPRFTLHAGDGAEAVRTILRRDAGTLASLRAEARLLLKRWR